MGDVITICSAWEKQCREYTEVDKGIGRLVQRLTENNIDTKFSHSGFTKDHPVGDIVHKMGSIPYICYDKKTPIGETDRKFYGCMVKALHTKSPFMIRVLKDKDHQCIYFPRKYKFPKEENDNKIKELWRNLENQLFKCLIKGDV